MESQILYNEMLKFLSMNKETNYKIITKHIRKLVKDNVINYVGYKGSRLHRKISLDISDALGHLASNGTITLSIDFEDLQHSLILVKDRMKLDKG